MRVGQSRRSQAVYLILCGLGVGWLIGMSVSPVLGTVVGGILATLLAIVSALVGVDLPGLEPKAESARTGEGSVIPSLHRVRTQTNVLPLTCVILSIVAGALVGVYGRTNQWLAADPQAFILKWQSAGLTHEQALQLLVQSSYGGSEGGATKEIGKKEDGKESETPQVSQSPLSPVLFSTVAPDECKTYKNLYGHGEELVRALAGSKDKRVRMLTKHLWETSKSPQIVELVTRELICAP
jgi:hypothetical protein